MTEQLIDYMGSVSGSIRRLPLNQVCLVGSHDAATWKIKGDSGLAPDAPQGIRDLIDPAKPLDFMPVHWFDSLLKQLGKGPALEVIAGWARAQEKSILEQLKSGVRYLDLRVCRHEDGTIWTHHALYSGPLNTVIDEVKEFMNLPGAEREIIILHFNVRLWNFDDTSRVQLATLLEGTFGDGIAPWGRAAPQTIMDEYWHMKWRVVVIYPSADECLHTRWAFPPQSIRSWWPGVETVSSLMDALKDELPKRDYSTFHVMQCQLTPPERPDFYKDHILAKPRSLKEMAEQTNPAVLEWISSFKAPKRFPAIIMIDHIQISKIPYYARELNKYADQNLPVYVEAP